MSALTRSPQRPSTSDTVTARLRAVLGEAPSTSDGPPTPRPGSRPSTSDFDDSLPAPGAGDRPSTSDGRWVGRFLPDGVRGARVDPGRRGAVALVLVVLLSAALVAGLSWRSRPRAEPVHAPAVVSASTSARQQAAPSLVVAVTGRVRRPGVVTVPAGARVIDALRAAGGPLPGADLTQLNLARKVADGELIAVGVPGAGPAPSGGDAPAGKVSLNTATLEQLDGLPGVGPVLAQRILDWRDAHGPFVSVDQLRDVTGIGDSKYEDLRAQVTV